MKSSNVIRALALAVGLSVTVTACKSRQPSPTPLDRTAGGGGIAGPGPGEQLTGPGGPTSTPGSEDSVFGQNRELDGWPEDREKFAADTVYFAFDSSAIAPGEESKIAAVADYLKANTQDAVKIEGHCDERGTEEYNRSLGERRALALREELARIGVDPGRVKTMSYGKDRPADPGHDEAAWKKNRRGVFVLLTRPK